MPANDGGQAVDGSVPRHLSQWKAERNKQAITRYMPGARSSSERA
jgi:hypothetical protein